MIYVFTGEGKGKTTAALGIGLRALGAGKKVLMVQFLKDGNSSEKEIIDKLDNFDVESFGRKGFFVPESKLKESPSLKEKGVRAFNEKDEKLMEEGLSFARNKIDRYDIVILDEINLVLHYNLIEEDPFLKFMDEIGKTHLILTGRHCPESVIEKADLVSDVREVKHYYRQGRNPIKGIDL